MQQIESEFAPAERADQNQLAAEIEQTGNLPLVNELTHIIPDAFVILNAHRQIVYCNQTLTDLLKVKDPKPLYGKRPGEALNCIHAAESAGGCGTTASCRYCGAVNAILDSQAAPGTLHTRECRMATGSGNVSVDLQVSAKTLALDGKFYTLLIARDIGEEKRKQVLERIFFHDITNTAGGIKGLIELMEDADEDEMKEFIHLAQNSSETLIEEIEAQRDLLAAENGDLKAEWHTLNSMDIIGSVMSVYKNHQVARGKSLAIDEQAQSQNFISDPRLLIRIIGNMSKNALEAESSGCKVNIGAIVIDENHLQFWVHNPSAMPENIKMQMFKRSFSTKGSGRGLGTYSIKLLGEKYLGGAVSFSTSKAEGTRFKITLPIDGGT